MTSGRQLVRACEKGEAYDGLDVDEGLRIDNGWGGEVDTGCSGGYGDCGYVHALQVSIDRSEK